MGNISGGKIMFYAHYNFLTQSIQYYVFSPYNKGLKLENQTELAYLTLQYVKGEEYHD